MYCTYICTSANRIHIFATQVRKTEFANENTYPITACNESPEENLASCTGKNKKIRTSKHSKIDASLRLQLPHTRNVASYF